MTNMHLFDENNKIKKYDKYTSIIRNYCRVRLEYYQKRKDYYLDLWKCELEFLNWKLKFIKKVIAEEIVVFKQKKAYVIEQLENNKFPQFPNKKTNDPEKAKLSYDYLTEMPISKFTREEIKKLQQKYDDIDTKLNRLKGMTTNEMWLEELDEFMEEYDKWDEKLQREYTASIKEGKKK